jgi:hypothetical protein
MQTNTNNEQEWHKKITNEFINEKLDQIKKTKKDDNSFIYLESETLILLLGYLLLKREAKSDDQTTNKNDNECFPDELMEELDTVIMNSKKSFEEILSQLKHGT